MKAKKDLQKAINNSLAKILENLIEILESFKSDERTQADAMKTHLFATRRMIGLTENLQMIFKNLVELKYIYKFENSKF